VEDVICLADLYKIDLIDIFREIIADKTTKNKS